MININTCSKAFLGMGAFFAVSVLSTGKAWSQDCSEKVTLEEKVDCLNNKLANVRVIEKDEPGYPLVIIEDANISIVPESNDDGSGNLIVGKNHTWTNSTGGFVSGFGNTIEGFCSTVNGGAGNISGSENQSTVNGGVNNITRDSQSTIIGGSSNSTDGEWATVCGGAENSAKNFYATASGGTNNKAGGQQSVVSGGTGNVAGKDYSVTAGGADNLADGQYSTVLGGEKNVAGGKYAAVVSGYKNVADGENSFILGGSDNKATNTYSAVVGGNSNSCEGNLSVIVAGSGNNIMDGEGNLYTISGGYENVINKNVDDGFSYAQTISGGAQTEMGAQWGWCVGNDVCFGNNKVSNIYYESEAIGILREYKETDDAPVTVEDIVILQEIPNDLSRVGGIISTVIQTPLSHVNVMAHQTKIPNVWAKDIMDGDYIKREIHDLLGQYVKLRVSKDFENGYELTPLGVGEEAHSQYLAHLERIRPKDTKHPPLNLDVTTIEALDDIGFNDSQAFGAKASNVAEMLDIEEMPENVMVPSGVAVPFSFYDRFINNARLHSYYEEFEDYYYCNFDIGDLEIDDYLDTLKKKDPSIKKSEVVANMFDLYLDNQSMDNDPECTNGGWFWFDKYNEIRFCKEACVSLKNGAVKTVSAEFGSKRMKKPRSSFYENFMTDLRVDLSLGEAEDVSFYQYAERMMADNNFVTIPLTREGDLWAFRKLIEGLPGKPEVDLPVGMKAELDEIYNYFINKFGDFTEESHLRCRSSSNNEDLDDFNGAGLYDSKTHKPKSEKHISKTIREIWASLWTFRAYEARWFYRIPQLEAAMGVLVHRNFKDEKVNGVSVTKNVSRNVSGDGYYVNAQKGEDLITNPKDAHTPEEFVILKLDNKPIYISRSSLTDPGEDLLTQYYIDQLADAMEAIHNHFAGRYANASESFDWDTFAMDLEFKVTKEGILAIKQARPWID